MTKEEHHRIVKEVRSILEDPENMKCICPNVKCEWHNDCGKCVAQHRYFKKHIPNCLQAAFSDKVKELAKMFEMTATENEKTPDEYWDYVREKDRQEKQS